MHAPRHMSALAPRIVARLRVCGSASCAEATEAVRRRTKLVAAHARRRAWQGAAWALEELRVEGLQPGVLAYGAVIGACERSSQWAHALSLAHQMRYDGLMHNAIICSAAISACGRGHLVPEALALLREVRALTGAPNVVAYGAAIGACARGRRWEDALNILYCMRAESVAPNVVVCSAAMSACERSCRWAVALSLFEQASMRLQLDVVAYGVAASACQRGQQWGTAVALVQHMRGKSIAANAVVVAAAIRSCEQDQLWDLALWLLRSMQLYGTLPDAVAHNAVLSALSKAGQWARAVEQLDEMQTQGLRPDVVGYTAAVGACGAARRWRWALELASRAEVPDGMLTASAAGAHELAQALGQLYALLLSLHGQRWWATPAALAAPAAPIARRALCDPLPAACLLSQHGALSGAQARAFDRAICAATAGLLRRGHSWAVQGARRRSSQDGALEDVSSFGPVITRDLLPRGVHERMPLLGVPKPPGMLEAPIFPRYRAQALRACIVIDHKERQRTYN